MACQLMACWLPEDQGFAGELRSSSVEAIELITSKPDCSAMIITDMTMPKMTDDELAAKYMR